jgi:release factor glutamine methyltransferase
MRDLVKYIIGNTYKPWLVRYLSRTRTYVYKGITLEIPPQVFHPGFFFSSKFLLGHLSELQVENKKFLDLGAGSGLLAIKAAGRGALVTATDINEVAVNYLKKNMELNAVQMEIIHSDLFDQIGQQAFDIIAINPPYYKKTPFTDAEHAWYCGEGGEYFQKLFQDLDLYTHNHSEVYMVLCDGCDLDMIRTIAHGHFFNMECVRRKKTILEEHFIFKIIPFA